MLVEPSDILKGCAITLKYNADTKKIKSYAGDTTTVDVTKGNVSASLAHSHGRARTHARQTTVHKNGVIDAVEMGKREVEKEQVDVIVEVSAKPTNMAGIPRGSSYLTLTFGTVYQHLHPKTQSFLRPGA